MDQRGLIMTGGANNGIYLCMHTFLEAGDYIFIPEQTYPNLFNVVSTKALINTCTKIVTIGNL